MTPHTHPALGAFSGNRRGGPGFLNFLLVICIISSVKKKYFAPSGPMPKEMSLRRKWKRVILCLDYICLNIYLLGDGWGTEITDILMPKILRR